MRGFCTKDQPFLLLILLAILATSVHAQERRPPSEGGMVYSLGLPGRTLAHGGLSGGAYLRGHHREFVAYGSVAGYRDFIHRAYSVMGLWGECYGGLRDEEGGKIDAGVRGMVMAPQFRIGAGVDYNFVDNKVDAIITTMLPIRRGGLLGHGSMLRIDWLPDRGSSFNIGIEVALQRYAGETRPARDCVRIPKPRSKSLVREVREPALTEALAHVREAAHWINRLTVPFLDHKGFTEKKGLNGFHEELQTLKTHMAEQGPLYPDARTIREEVRVYHDELDRAFSIAASGRELKMGQSTERGRRIAAQAREVLLEEVILRYDGLLGQRKKNDSLLGFGVNARGIFARWVNTESDLTDDRKDAVLYVLQSLIELLEENRQWSRDRWQDSRLVWIPLQYALRPEQHDTQQEMDRLIERATRREFTNGNEVYYIINEKFQFEVQKMILNAEDYHILWIHDFRGVDGAGEPDVVSFAQIVDSYYRAMIHRVREYDETGKLPVYMIIQDQYYYENNKSRRWHELLMDPMFHKIRLPRDYEWMEVMIDSVQAELRDAVASSHLLQAEAREYGEDWLKNRIKVHVSITHPADASFGSRYVLPIVGVHDNYIRDHRKISFYDITEDDPYKGAAIYTGMGIGEHYMGATWEDRGILARGPAVLGLKESCRELLLRNGFTEDEIPHVLRPKPSPANYDDLVSQGVEEHGEGRAMELHNVVGYGPKRISVFKALIYTLMPPGSVLLMPDFVWQSPLWASMAVGGALRGTRSLIVFPSLPNQPAPSSIPQSRAREMFRRLVIVQHELADEFARSGGMVKTGFYSLDVDVKDLRGRLSKTAEAFVKYPFLAELMHVNMAHREEFFARIEEALDREGYEVHHYVEDAKIRRPQLHLKAQFYASAEAWDTFFSEQRLEETGVAFTVAYARQLNDPKAEPTQFQETMAPIVRSFRSSIMESMTTEEVERMIVYLSVGSQNMSYRGLYLDGEVTFVASRGNVLTGVMDLLHVIEVSDWVDDVDELDRYMGSYGWFVRHLARLATPLM